MEQMRLDKYLKVSRLIKRRTIAKEIADQGRISINGKVAKSSSDVLTGDNLEIRFGNKTVTIEITKIVETTKKEASAEMYTVISEQYERDYRQVGDEN